MRLSPATEAEAPSPEDMRLCIACHDQPRAVRCSRSLQNLRGGRRLEDGGSHGWPCEGEPRTRTTRAARGSPGRPGSASSWSRCAAEAAYWSDRAVFTHQVKSAKAYADVAKRWNTTRPLPNVSLACASCSDAKRGPKYGAWTEARLPCTEDDDAFCAVDVGTHFRCCHFEGGFVPPTPPPLPRVWRPRRRRKAHTLQPGGVGVELLDGMTRGRVL